jgi:BMFP domain-containing protein YqiC
MLKHLEKQIRAVAEQLHYPLDIIDGKEFDVLQEQRKEPHFLVQIVEEDHELEEKEIEAPARLTTARGTLFNATSPAAAEKAVLLIEPEPVDKMQKKPAHIKPCCCVLL